MKQRPTLLKGCLAMAAVLGSASVLAETTICTVITQAMLPYTITAPGIYCVDQKLTVNMTSGAAITVASNNVVLDLNANAIGNLAAPAATTQAIGVLANSRQNVTVQNGIVRGFYSGVALIDQATPGTASGNAVYGMTSDQSRATGIVVEGTGAVVRNSRVVATNGSTALDPFSGANPNSAVGITAIGTGAQVISNEVIGTDCTNSCQGGSAATGIAVTAAPAAVIWQNRVINATLPTAALSQAIWITDAGSTNVFVDANDLAGYASGIVFVGTGKYRNTLTNNVTTPYTGGTPVGTNN
jgi:hypothetical protein